jgi:hypothetical protein
MNHEERRSGTRSVHRSAPASMGASARTPTPEQAPRALAHCEEEPAWREGTRVSARDGRERLARRRRSACRAFFWWTVGAVRGRRRWLLAIARGRRRASASASRAQSRKPADSGQKRRSFTLDFAGGIRLDWASLKGMEAPSSRVHFAILRLFERLPLPSIDTSHKRPPQWCRESREG